MALRMLSARAVSRAKAARVVGSRVTGTAALAKASAETVIRDSHPSSLSMSINFYVRSNCFDQVTVNDGSHSRHLSHIRVFAFLLVP